MKDIDMERLMGSVVWTAKASQPPPNDDGLPYATHEGTLDLLGHTLSLAQLNTGQRVFVADAAFKAFVADVLGDNPAAKEADRG